MVDVESLKDRNGEVIFEFIEQSICKKRMNILISSMKSPLCELTYNKFSDFYVHHTDTFISSEEYLDHIVKHSISNSCKIVLGGLEGQSKEKESLEEEEVDYLDYVIMRDDEEYSKVFEVYGKKNKIKEMHEDYMRRRGAETMEKMRKEKSVWLKFERCDVSMDEKGIEEAHKAFGRVYEGYTKNKYDLEDVRKELSGMNENIRDEEIIMLNRLYYFRYRKFGFVQVEDFTYDIHTIYNKNIHRQLLLLANIIDILNKGFVFSKDLIQFARVCGIKDVTGRKNTDLILYGLFSKGKEVKLSHSSFIQRILSDQDALEICSLIFK